MKKFSKLLALLSLGSICSAEDSINSSRFERLKCSGTEVVSSISDDINIFPEEYTKKLVEGKTKAEQRVDSRLQSFDYILRESSELYWKGEKDLFYDYDAEESEDLAKDILKDSLRETKDALPEISEIADNFRGFFKERFQLRIEPKNKQSYEENLPPEAEQTLRKKTLLNREAITVKTRGTLRKAVHKTFGKQTDFHSGFELHHLDDPEYFVSMNDPSLFGKKFAELKLSCILLDEPGIKAELGKEIGRGVYAELEAEQSFNSEYSYGLSFSRGLRENDSVSLRFSTGTEHGSYMGLEYRAFLPCKPVRDIKRFFFNRK